MEPSFSYKTRSANLGSMATEPVDLLVIGAGITGAAVARDAAMRRIRTAILDKGDFGSGASSRSSRMLHGGLQYLEHGHLRWVFKASGERRILLRIAPHLVWPCRFVFPLHEGGRIGWHRLVAGLWIYDALAAFSKAEHHRILGKRAMRRAEPRLKSRGLKGGASYYDAQCDDARLTLATVRSAHKHGALAANYVQVERLEIADGQVRGARVTDLVTGMSHTIHAHVVVNATGPWAKGIRDQVGGGPSLQSMKSVYIAVARQRMGNQGALTITSPVDGRIIFILPWGNLSYVGPVHSISQTPPDEAYASSADVVYLLRSANALFPDARLTPEDVVATWTGLHPALAPTRPQDPGSAPREHLVFESPTGLISMIGGEFATHRTQAAEVVDVVAERLHELDGRSLAHTAVTHLEPLPGGEARDLDVLIEEAERDGASRQTAEHLVQAYGSETPAVVRLAQADPRLADPIAPNHPAIRAELVHAMRREMALTLGDLLIRRTHLFYETPDHAESEIQSIAEIAAAEMAWDAQRYNAELAAYANEVEVNLAFRSELESLDP
ncbi:MAG: glycerol-3-phosphate dehydrogenase/oxidase [Gemmatimonadota bacterium]|nr:MAG: glycerol-3-phosphate dehydrogenase/oxidase [Gemmatimonadota bacterium]